MVDLPHVDTCADGERQRVGSPPSARLTIQIVDALREDLSPVLANSGFTDRAPAELVQAEREKAERWAAEVAELQQRLG